jgi:hypothetical protein
MSALPAITVKDIRARVGERSYEKGEDYYHSGAIHDARRQGDTLRARCEGSSGGPYRVEVTFDEDGIADAECSCPVGDGGHCKHVAALLLTWKNRPKEFAEVEETDAALEKRSKEELIALVKLMLRREPELDVLLDAPLPGVRGKGKPTNPDAYRRQAETAFRRDLYEWGAAAEVADELEAILEDGKQFLRDEDFAGAAAVYQGVLGVVLDHFGSVHDEPGDLHRVVHACVDGLEKCLQAAEDDPARREGILHAFFDLYRLDIEQGGIGLSDELPDFAEVCTPEERRTVAGWVREEMRSGGGDREWARGCFGGLLLDLEADTMDDEAYLRVCRETGRRHDLVDRLLRLGRTNEAVREAEKVGDWELTRMADLFVTHRHGDVADRLVRQRAGKDNNGHLIEWLKKRAAQRHDAAEVLELSEKLFRQQPSLEAYKELRKLAAKQGTWDELEPRLLASLKQGRRDDVLIQVYLEKGEIDRALEAVKGERPSYGWGYGHGMKMEVAKAAEKTRPDAAREIYRKEAEALIASRGRDNYKEACKYLKKVRDLWRQAGDEAAWTNYVARLREQNRTLRALLEEMSRAKL